MKKVWNFLIHTSLFLTLIGCGQKASIQPEITPPQSYNEGAARDIGAGEYSP